MLALNLLFKDPPKQLIKHSLIFSINVQGLHKVYSTYFTDYTIEAQIDKIIN